LFKIIRIFAVLCDVIFRTAEEEVGWQGFLDFPLLAASLLTCIIPLYLMICQVVNEYAVALSLVLGK
jgi:hypothetical protein